MKISNKDLASLKKLAQKLPVTYDLADQVVIKSIQNAQALMAKNSFGILPEPSDPKIVSEIVSVALKDQRLWPVNHLRRTKKAFIEGVVAGVDKYIKWVGENNRTLNEFVSRKMVIDTAKEISILS